MTERRTIPFKRGVFLPMSHLMVGLFLFVGIIGILLPVSFQKQLTGSVFIVRVNPASIAGEQNAVGKPIRDLDWFKESVCNSSAYDLCTDGQYIYCLEEFGATWDESNSPILNCTNVTCYAPDGNVRWSCPLHNGTDDFWGYFITYCGGALYAAGGGKSTGELGQHATICKLGLDGTIKWIKNFGEERSIRGLCGDDSGIYYAENNDPDEHQLIKVDPAGSVLWNQTADDNIECLSLYNNVIYGAWFNVSNFIDETISQWYTNGTKIFEHFSWPSGHGLPNKGLYACESGIYTCDSFHGNILKFDHQLNLVWNISFPVDTEAMFRYGDGLAFAGNIMGAPENRRAFIAVLGAGGDMWDNYTWISSTPSRGDACLELNGDLYSCGYTYSVSNSSVHAFLYKCKPDRYPVVIAPPALSYVKSDPLSPSLTFTIFDDYSPDLATLYLIDGVISNLYHSWEDFPNGTVLDFTSTLAYKEDGTYNCTLLADDYKFVSQATIMVTVMSMRFPIEWVLVGIVAAGAGAGAVLLAIRIKHGKSGLTSRQPVTTEHN